jgi:hypothetical protein
MAIFVHAAQAVALEQRPSTPTSSGLKKSAGQNPMTPLSVYAKYAPSM